jgi:hypothetical protein
VRRMERVYYTAGVSLSVRYPSYVLILARRAEVR